MLNTEQKLEAHNSARDYDLIALQPDVSWDRILRVRAQNYVHCRGIRTKEIASRVADVSVQKYIKLVAIRDIK